MMKKCNYFRIVASVLFMLLGTINTWADVEENLSLSMFRHWDGVGANAKVTGDVTGAVAQFNTGLGKGAVMYGESNGSVSCYNYVDISAYQKMVVNVNSLSGLRFLFNMKEDGTYIEKDLSFWGEGKAMQEIDIEELCNYYNLSYCHLNAIKVHWQSSGNVASIKLVGNRLGNQSDNLFDKCSKSFRIPNNKQKEFNFTIYRAYDTDGGYNWSLMACSKGRLSADNINYFFMDMAPSVERYNVGKDKETIKRDKSIYKMRYDDKGKPNGYAPFTKGDISTKDQNGNQILTDWGHFLEQLQYGATASVKVANYDGIIRVHCVINGSHNGSYKYVYHYEYEKEKDSEGNVNEDDAYVYFTVDHTMLANFTEHDEVGLGTIGYGVHYSEPGSNNTHYPGLDNIDHSSCSKTPAFDKTCYVTMATVDGFFLSRGTKWGIGDDVVYTPVAGPGWSFDGWSSGVADNPRTVTVKVGTGNENSYGAKFKKDNSKAAVVSDIATNRVCFFDFEDFVKTANNPSPKTLLKSSEAPTSSIKYDDNNKDNSIYYANNYYYMYSKNGIEGKIQHDPQFGYYYQNMATNIDEYTESKSENYLRITLSDQDKDRLTKAYRYGGDYWKPKPSSEVGATVGFWVNARWANKYELPLERGSMFAIFSDEKFLKAQYETSDLSENDKPRYMFDIACNGWTYAYLPCTPGGDVHYTNKFFYGETANVLETGQTPQVSLFGENNYAHAQDQRHHKFYDDDRWHYVTYVVEDDYKKITMYLDGEVTGTLDTRSLGSEFNYYDENGEYASRIWHLRNIVLGGFTPHGLFFGKQFYSDAALAYDDVSLYSEALSQEKIKAIIDAKMVTPSEWHFANALKTENGQIKITPDADAWTQNGDIFASKSALSSATLMSSQNVVYGTEGLKFSGAAGKILIDRENGLIGLKKGATITIPNIPQNHSIYFVVRPNASGNSVAADDIRPTSNTSFNAGGLGLYGKSGEDDCRAILRKCTGATGEYIFEVYGSGSTHYNSSDPLWISDIIISPYQLIYNTSSNAEPIVTYYARKVGEVEKFGVTPETNTTHTLDGMMTALSNRGVYVNFYNLGTSLTEIEPIGGKSVHVVKSAYREGSASGPYVRFRSSAPHVAYVDNKGVVNLTGLAGHATISAELIFNNLHDGYISTACEIRIVKNEKTNTVVKEDGVSESAYGVGKKFAVRAFDQQSDAITMTMGGWNYTESYKGSEGDNMVNGMNTDSWSKGFGHLYDDDVESIDGFVTASQGGQNAKSESYLKPISEKEYDDGTFGASVVNTNGVVHNETPWQLPCRGSYLKFEPNKAGVLSVYVLQNGNLHKDPSSLNYSNHVKWRPVYVTDETGAIVTDIKVATNSKISVNDNFFREGRRRAQFIEGEEGTYNQKLKDDLIAMRDGDAEQRRRFKVLVDSWENVGWKQKVIETGDGGYMVMSKGIVRYTFNVYPGKTYYIFSNHTKLGYSGFNFEENKLLNSDSYETDPIRYADPNSDNTASKVNTRIEFRDVTEGTGGYHQPTFPTAQDCTPVLYTRNFTKGKWGSICLPFSMNNKQMKENFGDETSVVLLKGIDDKGVVQMVWHVNQDIIAGYPYFILPRGKESITQISTNAYFDPTVTAPSFVIGPEMDNGQSATYGSIELLEKAVGKTEYPYVFKGNFDTEQATAGSYVMTTSGVLTKASNTPNIKPFRAYLRYCSQIDASSGDHANGKPLTGMGYMNSDGEEVTTSIEQILEANGIFVDSANVYGIDGQVKRYNTHDLNGLPKGIYIVNGKKYVVK